MDNFAMQKRITGRKTGFWLLPGYNSIPGIPGLKKEVWFSHFNKWKNRVLNAE